MPLFNGEKYVEEAILSVLSQTIADWELIVVDDGSTDQSLEIARKFESEKVQVLSQINSGASVARNRGLEQAKGEFIKFLDADDLLDKDCLEKQISIQNELSENQIVFGDYSFIDEQGNLLHQHQFDQLTLLKNDPEYFFLTHWEILITCPLHRKIHLQKIGGFDEKLPYGQESDLHFRLANAGVEFVYSPHKVFCYRSHGEATRISGKREEAKGGINPVIIYKFNKYENLLLNKYGELSPKFKRLYYKIFFNFSRKFFDTNNNKDGRYYLKKARYYQQSSLFLNVYYVSGLIFGYHKIEKLVQKISKIKNKNTIKQDNSLGKFILNQDNRTKA